MAGSPRQNGQALIEVALSAPVLLVLLLGAFNVGVLLSDKIVAGYASRQGARLAAQVGGGNGMTTSQIDQQVVQNVVIAASNLNYATMIEIDIYAPSGVDGSLNRAVDQYNSYDARGSSLHLGFPSTSRNQVPPNETSIGVQVVWQYSPPTGYQSFSVQMNEYTVMKAAPVVSG